MKIPILSTIQFLLPSVLSETTDIQYSRYKPEVMVLSEINVWHDFVDDVVGYVFNGQVGSHIDGEYRIWWVDAMI
jgi:hypothetical protein